MDKGNDVMIEELKNRLAETGGEIGIMTDETKIMRGTPCYDILLNNKYQRSFHYTPAFKAKEDEENRRFVNTIVNFAYLKKDSGKKYAAVT